MKHVNYQSGFFSNTIGWQKAAHLQNAKLAEIQDTEIGSQDGYDVFHHDHKVLPQKDGGFILVQNYISVHESKILATKFDVSGKKVKTLSFGNGNKFADKVIVSQNGDDIYVVQGGNNGDSDFDYHPRYFLQRLDSNLEKKGTQTKLDIDNVYSTFMRSITISDRNEIIVLYNAPVLYGIPDVTGNTNYKLYMEKFDATGAKIASRVIDAINDIPNEMYDAYYFFDIEAIALPEGKIAVSWGKESPGNLTTDLSTDAIYLQRFDANFSEVGERIQQITTRITENTISGNTAPFLKSLGDEGFIFGSTKVTASQDLLELQIDEALLTKYDLNGDKVASFKLESAIVTGSDSVTTLKNGNIAVAFGRLNSGNGLQMFEANGNKLGAEVEMAGQFKPDRFQETSNLVTTLNNGEIIVTHIEKRSQEILTERFTSQMERLPFVTSPIFTVEGLEQKLSFDQMSSRINFKDIIIHPLLPSDQFVVTMTLKMINANGVEEVVTDEDMLLIQQESMDEDGVGSEFSNGTLTVKGTAEQIKKSLQDLQIEIGGDFADPENDVSKIFSVEVAVEDKTNHQVKTGEIYADYQCLELPQELIKAIGDQKSEKGKALIMDFARIYHNPSDPRFEKIILSLNQIFDSSTDHPDRIMDIKKLSETVFEIFGSDMDNIKLSLETQGYCKEIIGRDFKLNPQLTSSAESKDSSTDITYGIGAGALLFTALACLVYKKLIAKHDDQETPRTTDIESATAEKADKVKNPYANLPE